MEPQHVFIQSIRDRQSGGPFLAFDLCDVLRALASCSSGLRWCVVHLDTTGGPSIEKLCEAVEATAGKGLWLGAKELEAVAQDMRDTVECTVLGFPEDVSPEAVLPEELRIGDFPISRARLAIAAVDGMYFEVFAKEPLAGELLSKRFQDVRNEDPTAYF